MEVRELVDIDDLHRAARLFREIWAAGPADAPLTPELLRALADHGGYVAGAWRGPELVGASAGFVGVEDGGLVLHSHITGVRADAQGSGAGLALKHHQRDWARERAIGTITWTFDPLVRRNGWFNLVKLGAVIVGYRERYYGDMADGVNAGDESDRCLVEWRIDDDPDQRGAGSRALAGAGSLVLCRVPEDILTIRRLNPRLARAWRLAVRETMAPALAAGHVGTGMTEAGAYILTRS